MVSIDKNKSHDRDLVSINQSFAHHKWVRWEVHRTYWVVGGGGMITFVVAVGGGLSQRPTRSNLLAASLSAALLYASLKLSSDCV